jgi:hypothetical protein
MSRDLGIVVFPEFFQTEGVGRVLDNLQQRANVSAIATSPYVMRPATEADGGREPPIDGGAGSVRLLDRSLWGRRELFVRTSVAFEPNRDLYSGLRYQPPAPDEHTRASGSIVHEALMQARSRGLRTYLQVQAAIPPGYRVQFGGPQADDEPLMFDGTPAPDRLDKNGSLASPHIRDYTAALLRDLAQFYPDVDGFHIDWPEYPPYTLDSAFLDFGPHAQQAAGRLGFDFDAMRGDSARLHDWLTRKITFDELRSFGVSGKSKDAFGSLLEGYPGVSSACEFKARLAMECVGALRKAVPGKQIVLRSFPPPWTHISGFSFPAMAPLADAICVKLFTMHWPMMVNSWALRMLRDNPGLGGHLAVSCILARVFGLTDSPEKFKGAIAEYPEPDVAHPVDAAAMQEKLDEAVLASSPTKVFAMPHGYGPVRDFSERLKIAWNGASRKVWINRYGYLSDEKLDAVGRICS